MSDSGRTLGDSYNEHPDLTQMREAVRKLEAAATPPVAPPPVQPPAFQKPPSIYNRPIQEHGGGKYLRKIYPADGNGAPILVDVYCVIEAFREACPALNMAPMQHALKKLLCCGVRGKGSEIDDVHGVFDAMWRALELLMQRQAEAGTKEGGS